MFSPWPFILQDHSSTARGTGRLRPRSRCLLSIPRQSAVDDVSLSPPLRIALLNARSIANKSFVLNDFFSSNSLDFMFLTESWQRENEFIHLNELCPVGCRFIGTPRLDRRGGGLVTVHRDNLACRTMNSEFFPSFESQLLKVGFSDIFYCVLIYRPPGPAGVFIQDFTDFLSSIIKLEKVLMIGDFNLHVDVLYYCEALCGFYPVKSAI